MTTMLKEGILVRLLAIYLFCIADFLLAVNMTALKGGSFSMPCYNGDDSNFFVDLMFTSHGSSSELIGKHQPSTQDTQIISSRYVGRLSFTPSHSITIRNIDVQDEGKYECFSRGFQVQGNQVKSNNLEVYVRPKIVVNTFGSHLDAGSGLVQAASCTALGGKPAARIFWKTERFLLFSNKTSTTDSEDAETTDTESILSVAPTQFYHNQPFICTVEHVSFTDGHNATMIRLNVQYSPNIPVINVINANTKLKCEADGNPKPNITWIMPSNYQSSSPSPSTIEIISPDDPSRENDTYVCQASNGISPSTTNSITTADAVRHVSVVKTTNTGAIVGIVVGLVLIIAITGVAVYWFFIRKYREKDSGPYNPRKIAQSSSQNEGGWGQSSGRPITQRSSGNLDESAPRGHNTNSNTTRSDDEDSTHSPSDEEEVTRGHVVDINSPVTELDDDTPMARSKNSVNFQYQRSSTSPHRSQLRPSSRTPRMSDPLYEVPPKDYYEDGYDDEEDGQLMGDHNAVPTEERLYDRPEDRYPGCQPRYTESPHTAQDTVQYASIDHSHNAGKARTRPPYEEPVKYEEIRSKVQIV